VKAITMDLMKTAYADMTDNQMVLKLLSEGIVEGISTIVQLPSADSNPF
jgi:hypothetical protein